MKTKKAYEAIPPQTQDALRLAVAQLGANSTRNKLEMSPGAFKAALSASGKVTETTLLEMQIELSRIKYLPSQAADDTNDHFHDEDQAQP